MTLTGKEMNLSPVKPSEKLPDLQPNSVRVISMKERFASVDDRRPSKLNNILTQGSQLLPQINSLQKSESLQQLDSTVRKIDRKHSKEHKHDNFSQMVVCGCKSPTFRRQPVKSSPSPRIRVKKCKKNEDLKIVEHPGDVVAQRLSKKRSQVLRATSPFRDQIICHNQLDKRFFNKE